MLGEFLEVGSSPDVLIRLRQLCDERGQPDLSGRLGQLHELLALDMRSVETELESLRGESNLAQRAASHLLDAGGKRLRPLCVALAARAGEGFDTAGLDLAVAVELVHNATLLHDDVIDGASSRRGLATARRMFGNTASIFAGDWLLIEALRRVNAAGVAGTLERLLDTIEQMIVAETLQLELQGCVDTTRELYFEIVEGKSATLFRWAMFAGARCGRLPSEATAALESFGADLGVAFQLIDDVLDLEGDSESTGKRLFGDLREGKMTYPLIVAREREPALRGLLGELLSDGAIECTPEALRGVLEVLHRTEALVDCRRLADSRIQSACRALERVPPGEATAALMLVAQATLGRDR